MLLVCYLHGVGRGLWFLVFRRIGICVLIALVFVCLWFPGWCWFGWLVCWELFGFDWLDIVVVLVVVDSVYNVCWLVLVLGLVDLVVIGLLLVSCSLVSLVWL